MRIFEYPYIIITILVFCFIILGGMGAYFALQGFKTAKGKTGADFSHVSKLEGIYARYGKLRKNRCVIYISLFLDNVRSMYSDAMAWEIYAELKPSLLMLFGADEGGIAQYDQTNFIAVNPWSKEQTTAATQAIKAEVNRCLLRRNAINTVEVRIGSYFGLATDVSFTEAINRARQACALADEEKKDYMEWDMHHGKTLEKRIQIENNIENEIDNNRFFLEYQPFVDAKTKKIIGAEVLSRLNSAQEGVLTPGSFLTAVNSVGLNDKFDYYIFEKNCKWISNNKAQRGKYVYTINFSRSTLCDRNFAERLLSMIESYGVPYSAIAVEVLENEKITAAERECMVQNIKTLKERGILVFLDDFGSGYTTYGDLQHLTIDTLKIDKSIIQRSGDETGFMILKNIIRTAKDLGLKTIGEGIETKEQERVAVSAGCDFLQGYYYYKPMSVTKLEKILEENGDF